MRLYLKLRSPQDKDLIALYTYYSNRKFIQMIRDSLLSCITKTSYMILIPDNIEQYARESPWHIDVNIYLNEASYIPVIDYLRSLPEKSKSSVIKLLVRSRYDSFPLHIYIEPVESAVISKNTLSTPTMKKEAPFIQEKKHSVKKEKQTASQNKTEGSFNAFSQFNLDNLFGNNAPPNLSHLK